MPIDVTDPEEIVEWVGAFLAADPERTTDHRYVDPSYWQGQPWQLACVQPSH